MFLTIGFQNIVFSQTNKNLNTILNKLNITEAKIAMDFICIKSLPYEADATIYAIPVKTEDEEGYWSADIHLLKVSNKTDSILIHSIFKDKIQSDAVKLYKIWIDTAPYYIKNDKRAFAIRFKYANNSSAAGYDWEDFSLIQEEDNNFEQIFKLDTYSNLVYGGGDCENTEFFTQKSILLIDKSQTNSDYFNIIEKIHFEHYFLDKDCEDGKKEIKKFQNVYQFIDNTYSCKGKRLKGMN